MSQDPRAFRRPPCLAGLVLGVIACVWAVPARSQSNGPAGLGAEGIAVDPEGKPLAGVAASLAKARVTGLSAADGSFRLDLDGHTALRTAAGVLAAPFRAPLGFDLTGRTVPRLRFAWSFPIPAVPAVPAVPASPAALGKAAAVVDTLTLQAAGFALKTLLLDGYGKSYGRIELSREAPPEDTVLFRSGSLEVRQSPSALSLHGPTYGVTVDLAEGVYHVQAAGRRVVWRAFAEADLEDKRRLRSTGYPAHLSGRAYLQPLQDAFGKGVRVSVEHRDTSKTSLWQRFYLYEEKPYFLVDAEARSPQGLACNNFSPLATLAGAGSGLSFGGAFRIRALSMPWDNDKYRRHIVYAAGTARESYGAAAVFDAATREGLILGAVDHSLWKTGIQLADIQLYRAVVKVYGGAGGSETGDSEPHGMLRGTAVASPKILVGLFPDWRAGLEEYGRACALVAPPLAWDKGVPFGWNSWAAVGTALSAEAVDAAAGFLKTELMDKQTGFGGGGGRAPARVLSQVLYI
jgi:hypothetical protein